MGVPAEAGLRRIAQDARGRQRGELSWSPVVVFSRKFRFVRSQGGRERERERGPFKHNNSDSTIFPLIVASVAAWREMK